MRKQRDGRRDPIRMRSHRRRRASHLAADIRRACFLLVMLLCGVSFLIPNAVKAGGQHIETGSEITAEGKSEQENSASLPDIVLRADRSPVNDFYTSDVSFTVAASAGKPLAEISAEVFSDGVRTQKETLWREDTRQNPGKEETAREQTENESSSANLSDEGGSSGANAAGMADSPQMSTTEMDKSSSANAAGTAGLSQPSTTGMGESSSEDTLYEESSTNKPAESAGESGTKVTGEEEVQESSEEAQEKSEESEESSQESQESSEKLQESSPDRPEQYKQTCRFTVNAGLNNSDHVLVRVTVTTQDGEETHAEREIRICATAPEISVKISGKAMSVRTEDGESHGYCSAGRDAEVTIRDRASAFDRHAAEEGILAEGAELGEWEEDGDIHRLRLHFPVGAAYRWSVHYQNLAGLDAGRPKTEGDTPFSFTLDEESPQVMLTAGEEEFTALPQEGSDPLISRDAVAVKASAQDALSPVRLMTYASQGGRILTEQELAAAAWEEHDSVSLDQEGVYRVWLKAVDAAGNSSWAGSRAVLIDRTPVRIRVKMPDEEDKTFNKEEKIYNEDVPVRIEAEEDGAASGIQSLTWQVQGEGEEVTQSGSLLDPSAGSPEAAGGKIVVSARRNNSDHVRLVVRARDRAGNVSESTVTFSIDVTTPKIKVDYGEDIPHHGRYFQKARTAEITITERSSHFSRKKAEKGLSIQAEDRSGKPVHLSRRQMISEWTDQKGSTPDEDTHTVSILFPGDANYRFRVNYADEAGNQAEAVETSGPAPWRFTVDHTPPVLRVLARSDSRSEIWERLARQIGFGFSVSGKIQVSADCEDAVSPLEDLRLLKNPGDEALTTAQLRGADGWQTADHTEIKPGKRAAVWFRAEDYAGNVSYSSSDGVIADAGRPEIAPEIRISGMGEQSGIAAGDIRLRITAADTGAAAGAYGATAGLRRVRCEVKEEGNVIYARTLYENRQSNPAYSSIRSIWSGSVVIKAGQKSQDLQIHITAEDRAGNRNGKVLPVSIDPVEPGIRCRVQDSAGGSEICYPEARTMEISVLDKNFEPELCEVKVLRDGNIMPVRGSWKDAGGTGDERTHILRIPFREDGEYQVSVSACDLAGNRSHGVTAEAGTENPWHFIIDTEAPKIVVSYDNNRMRGGRYFNQARTAKIRIYDRNFRPELADVKTTLSLDGKRRPSPVVRWLTDSSSEEGVYAAVIRFQEDGDYTLSVTARDLAGNHSTADAGGSAAPWEFTIDRFRPDMVQIHGVPAEAGNPAEAGIRIADRHLTKWNIRLTRSRVLTDPRNTSSMQAETGRDVTDRYIAQTSAAENQVEYAIRIPKCDKDGTSCDGLYCLQVMASDLAGNVWRTPEKGIFFPVNRFGSVYVLGSGLAELTGEGGRFVQKIGEPLTLSEYNTGTIGRIQTEVTKDGRAISGEAHITRSGGGGTWNCCTYRWDPDLFEEDGVYRISVRSEDENHHISESESDLSCQMVFRVDTTAPDILSVSGLEKRYIRAAEQNVTVRAFDSLGVRSIALLDGSRQIARSDHFTDSVRPVWTCHLPAGRYDHLKFILSDYAGNVCDTDQKDASGRYILGREYPLERTVMISPGWFILLLAHGRLLLLLTGASAAVAAVGAGKKRGRHRHLVSSRRNRSPSD